eukprot:TRINITY_DN7995_c0_g1_i4.p1 TRINITY_DN7995_c0_g1~~TRINITY_DN7995_c0_g1_i4.p1  ORF type:complete len:267 (+),score=34.73 TRINITY_DN7995_c0_g1_i4:215-1015(+)
MFWLASPEIKTLEFLSHFPQEKREWMEAINDAIIQLISNNQHLAEERASKSFVISEQGIPEFQESDAGQFNQSMVRTTSFRKLIHGSLKLAVQTIVPPTTTTSTTTLTKTPTEEKLVLDEEPREPTIDEGFVVLEEKAKMSIQLCRGVKCVSGHEMVRLDARHSNFPLTSWYLLLEGSYNYIFGRSIGYITIRNNSEDQHCTLGSWQLYVPPHRPTFFLLKSKKQACFDFKGDWCIEIVQGDKHNLEIVEFQTFGGSGEHNLLNMV